MKALIISVSLILVACASTVPLTESTNTEGDFAEIPFNFDVKANNLPALDKEGSIIVIVNALVSVKEVAIAVKASGGVDIVGNPHWIGDIVPGINNQLEFGLKAVEEGPAKVQVEMIGFVRGVKMSRIGEISLGVGKRGTLLEDKTYSSSVEE